MSSTPADDVRCRCCGATGEATSASDGSDSPQSPGRLPPSPLVVPPPFDGALRRVLQDLKKELGDTLVGQIRQRRLFKLPSSRFVPPITREQTPGTDEHQTKTPNPRKHGTSRKKHIGPTEPVDFVETEVFINPPSQMIREIRQHESPTVQAWRTGHVLLDDEAGTVMSIRNLARTVFEEGRPRAKDAWTPFQLAWARYTLVDRLNDSWDAIEAGEPASGMNTLVLALDSALDLLYACQGWWEVKPKKRLRDLEAHSRRHRRSTGGDEAGDIAGRVLPLAKRIARSDLEVVERHRALALLVDMVLEPLGGRMDEWVTDWEPCEG
ncbi:hypothetical protein HK405_003167 [Cladochytrium tenue]|nr:hypothetical protein HK405_003167 [Cladochytrium tenue]